MKAEAMGIVDPRAERRWCLAFTAVFVGLVLLSAAIKWIMGWPVGSLIVFAIGVFYILVPVYRHQPLKVGLMFGACLLGIGLHVAAADVNSPVANLGTMFVALSMAGGTFSPYLLRPRRFETMWRDLEQAAP